MRIHTNGLVLLHTSEIALTGSCCRHPTQVIGPAHCTHAAIKYKYQPLQKPQAFVRPARSVYSARRNEITVVRTERFLLAFGGLLIWVRAYARNVRSS